LRESEFLREVLARAKKQKVQAFHSYGPPVSTKGFPDLVLAGEHGLAFTELKSEDGETSAEQDLWIWILACSGHPVHLLRPMDLDNGVVDELLRSIA
jgi:hypothetical protein